MQISSNPLARYDYHKRIKQVSKRVLYSSPNKVLRDENLRRARMHLGPQTTNTIG